MNLRFRSLVILVVAACGAEEIDSVNEGFGTDFEGLSLAYCAAGQNVIVGTSGDDVLRGTSGQDCIFGLEGNDRLEGGGGADNLVGGPGNDVLLGGGGNDRLLGQKGEDQLDGEEGNDSAEGGAGNDAVTGGIGKDILTGGDGDDVVTGGDADDYVAGNAGDDVLSGGQGSDRMFGGPGDDQLTGGRGNDNIAGGDGADRIDSGAGADIVDGEAGCDVINGGADNDVISGAEGKDFIVGGAGVDRIDGGADEDSCDDPGSVNCEDIVPGQACTSDTDCLGGQRCLEGSGLCALCLPDETCGGAGCCSRGAECTAATCGNWIVEEGEQCDDGGRVPGDGCSQICQLEQCGNGIFEPGAPTESLTFTWLATSCGWEPSINFLLNGQQVYSETVLADCVCEVPVKSFTTSDPAVLSLLRPGMNDVSVWFDQYLAWAVMTRNTAAGSTDVVIFDANEGLDGANRTPNLCDATYWVGLYWSALFNTGEQCDDGAFEPGDGCSPWCMMEACGNGAFDPGEECDDRNLVDGDGCSAGCLVEYCGNGRLDPGEECDDGNGELGDGCSACLNEICGNQRLEGLEECDDGNEVEGDGCKPTCIADFCGDGIVTENVSATSLELVWLATGWSPGVISLAVDGNPVFSGDANDPMWTCFPGIRTVSLTDPAVLAQLGDGPHSFQLDFMGRDGQLAWAVAVVHYGATPREVVLYDAFGGGDAERRNADLCWAGAEFSVTRLSDAVLDGPNEECDDGNMTDGDGCSAQCLVESCGNGRKEGLDECDDGNHVDGDGCTAACRLEVCGDGILTLGDVVSSVELIWLADDCSWTAPPITFTIDGEPVFSGPSDPDGWCSCFPGIRSVTLTDANTLSRIRNGNVRFGVEVTGWDNVLAWAVAVVHVGATQTELVLFDAPGGNPDDASVRNPDRCWAGVSSWVSSSVDRTFSGLGEECEDSNTVDGDGCSARCLVESCGNGRVEGLEQCDDANDQAGDGCNACVLELCGDGITHPGLGEECDDGGVVGGDGCDARCLLEACGNGRLESNETCDDFNTTSGDGCSETCQAEYCGDGVTQPGIGEECDDANPVAGDGCAGCLLEVCGNGRVDANESCDDGNEDDSDGCGCGCILTAFDAANCGGCGIVCAPGESCFGSVCGTASFQITSLGTDCTTIEHNNFTGDDRGGIALSRNRVFYSGDWQTGAFDASDLTFVSGTGMPLDAMTSDLKTGRAYVFGDERGMIFGGGGRATRLLELDSNAMPTASQVIFSRPVVLGYSTGFFAGYGYVLVLTEGRALVIELPSGRVSDLGPMSFPRANGCENWAIWGTSEFFDGRFWINYASWEFAVSTITRARVPDGLTEPIGSFGSLSDMCSFTISPERSRWYWHHEGCSDLACGDEQLGFCSATYLAPGRGVCGDLVVDPSIGEECDDGNLDDNDGCDSVCLSHGCGNGRIEAGEQCDDGNDVSGDGCSSTCFYEYCGDGFVQPGLGEECDDGNGDGGDGCGPTCLTERCGNGWLDPGEGCDDGNTADGDGCSQGCVPEFCGDGTIQPGLGEECEDGNADNGDGCDSACRIESCGNGRVEGNEPCDDGNDVVGDGCSPGCVLEYCGDGLISEPGTPDYVELTWLATTCAGPAWVTWWVDDVQIHYGEGATAECICNAPIRSVVLTDPILLATLSSGSHLFAVRLEDPFGGFAPFAWAVATLHYGARATDISVFDAGGGNDGLMRNPDICSAGYEPFPQTWTTLAALGEECDDGNTLDGDGCSAACLIESCGNGRTEGLERCDDGNTLDGDGCSSSCQPEFCGDGVLQLMEQCDDGNFDGGDGCSPWCTIEVCGNFILDAAETCDDGNVDDGDGCNSLCQLEFCGDFVLQPSEECDDGNSANGDGCDSSCRIESCGNARVEGDEECDDGNAEIGDGCSPLCLLDECGDGVLTPRMPITGLELTWLADSCPVGMPTEVTFSLDGQPIHTGPGADPVCWCFPGVRSTMITDPAILDLLQTGVHTFEVSFGGTPTSLAWAVATIHGLSPDGATPRDGGFDTPESGMGPDVIPPPPPRGDAGARVATATSGDDGGVRPRPDTGLGTDAGVAPGASLDIVIFDAWGGNDASWRNPDLCWAGAEQMWSPRSTTVFLRVGEECDDGNVDEGDGCGSTCLLEQCGNAHLDPGEACDDGNAQSGDGCDATCALEYCSDGIVQPGIREECDDGNLTNGDGCDWQCLIESCGNGRAEGNEECDDGNRINGDGCGRACNRERCGDGIIQDLDRREECDDGNAVSGDGCAANCLIESCGNGRVEGLEQCDDANADDTDGCGCGCRRTATDPQNCGVCGNVCSDPTPGCSDGACTTSFTFSGILNDVPVSSLAGWTQCFSESYGNWGTPLETIAGSCPGSQWLLGCRMQGAELLLVAANAPREDVMFDTGTGNLPHDANGVGWYFSPSWSWGFAPQGAPISRNSCDTFESWEGGPTANQRLCLHTKDGILADGWRCGAAFGIGPGFERVIFQAN
ncbi:MAG: DUF4215 domain-containing protein [Deltaproteobacteria bacterium]|nr:DUF4215 domain-containing protein [Deltaproteobacteria bacterium]